MTPNDGTLWDEDLFREFEDSCGEGRKEREKKAKTKSFLCLQVRTTWTIIMLPFYSALEVPQASDATLLVCRTFTRVFAARRERPQPAHTTNRRQQARNLVWFHASWGSRPLPSSNGSRVCG